MRHSYPCHVSPGALGPEHTRSERNGQRCRLDPELLDTARCPCCRAPLIARMGRDGPYFHCRCRERSSCRHEPEASGDAELG
ncbi:MAG TPA: hypothetical protein VMF69_05815 [Gemmataceae bacterium]|nr:hypothetical protein [Gemmataceae bacterium]